MRYKHICGDGVLVGVTFMLFDNNKYMKQKSTNKFDERMLYAIAKSGNAIFGGFNLYLCFKYKIYLDYRSGNSV